MKKIKLVLSGSGTLYPVHVGGILRLAEAGYEISEVCGTSGGAIVAAALGTGYKPNTELVKMIKATLPHKHNVIKPSLWTLFWRWGLIKSKDLESVMNEYLALRLGDTVIPTHIVAANIDTKTHRIFNSKDDPDFSLAKAVRTSISIPFVFEPIKIDGQLYVDGGVAANFPLDIFGTGKGVVGFRVRGKKTAAEKKISNIKDYTSAVLDTLIETNMKEHIEDAIFAKTIFLESEHDSLNFNISDTDVDAMIREGYDAVDSWLQTNILEGHK
jgi:NTE family protein